MTVHASMLKRIPATGEVADDIPDLFRRNETINRFRGFATFGEEGTSSVLLEVADTPEKRAHGLMGRTRLPACYGMLFKDLDGGSFWMKGCKIPLDIVFLGDDGVITRVYTMEADGGVRRYPYGDEKTAIELPAGFCAINGISVGTPCTWRTW